MLKNSKNVVNFWVDDECFAVIFFIVLESCISYYWLIIQKIGNIMKLWLKHVLLIQKMGAKTTKIS